MQCRVPGLCQVKNIECGPPCCALTSALYMGTAPTSLTTGTLTVFKPRLLTQVRPVFCDTDGPQEVRLVRENSKFGTIRAQMQQQKEGQWSSNMPSRAMKTSKPLLETSGESSCCMHAASIQKTCSGLSLEVNTSDWQSIGCSSENHFGHFQWGECHCMEFWSSCGAQPKP